MIVDINGLVDKLENLIPIYSKKFSISNDGARKFIKLSIEYLARTEFKLEVSESSIGGDEEKIQELITEVMRWDEDEFDEEDFEVIGYCQNIR
ncbi:MAG: hypothetical protein ACTSWR_03845 [Candidatus Helarchaeota archaeon]